MKTDITEISLLRFWTYQIDIGWIDTGFHQIDHHII